MRKYNSHLKQTARKLRSDMSDSELCLWSRLRRKQLLNVQFYRQKPIGHYVVDFYAPKAGLVIEIDGSQHFEKAQMEYDQQRSLFLEKQGLKVLRFDNLQVLQETDRVVEVIYRAVLERVDV